MEEFESAKNEELRDSLIIAGIAELEKNGLSGFSLRRVASECSVSCAAPYRHFKSKDDLILAIISYIGQRWTLLCDHIRATFGGDTRRALVEVCVANIRFWIANPNFRSIMILDDRALDSLQLREKSKLTSGVRELVTQYCRECAISPVGESQMSFSLLSIIYGAVQMIGSGELDNTPETMCMIKKCIEKAIVVE